MGDFSVKAILSATDKNFSSTMKSALGYTNNLKDTLTSGIGFGAMMAIGQSAVNTVVNKMSSLSKETVETSDSMYKLQAAMRFSGYAEDEIQRIAGATGSLKTYADKTVFSLQDVMSTFGALSANGIKDADKLTEAVGNAVAVFGGGAQEYSSVALAFSQAMAAGALHAQDWNQILNASPQLAGGLRKELIRLNPKLGKDFKGAMEKGAITADMLAEAMNNIGMTEMAKEAATSVTTFEGAMGNLEATAVSGMMKLYDTFAKSKVIDAINVLNDKVGAGFDWLAESMPKAIDKISPYWRVFKKDFAEVKDAFGSAVSAIIGEVGKLTGAFGSPESVNNFSDVLGTASGALKTFAGFCEEHADVIAKVITMLPKLYAGYRGFKIVKAVAPFVGAFTGAVGGLAKLGLSKLAPNLFNVAKGQDAVGKSSGGSSKKMLASAKAFMMLGVGVLTISAGFYLLAQSAIAVANAGPLAVGVLVGLVGIVTALSVGMIKMLSTMSGGTKKLATMSKAMLALGASILLISAGFWILSDAAVRLAEAGPLAVGAMFGMVVAIGALLLVAKAVAPALSAGAVGFIAFGAAVVLAGAGMMLMTNAAINLANAGPLAIGVMVGMVGAIALLAAGAAALGPALTVGAVGFIAFGAAILMVSAGVFLACAGVALLTQNLPLLVAYGVQGAAVLTALGLGMTAFAVGAGIAGAAAIVLGVGLAVAAIGIAAVGVAVGILGVGMMLVATSTLLASAGVALLATQLPVIAACGARGAVSIAALGAGMLVFAAGSAAAGVACVALGAGITVVAAGLGLVAAVVLVVAAGVLVLAAGSVALGAGMLLTGAALMVVGAALPMVVAGTLASTVAFATLLAMSAGLAVSLALLAVPLALVGTEFTLTSVGVAAFALAMTTGCAGVVAMAVALKSVNSSMKSIAKNAKTAKSAISSMVSAVDIINSGLDALGSKAKSAVNKFVSVFSGGAGQAQSAGKNMANGVKNGVQAGLAPLPNIATTTMAKFNSSLRSGGSGAVATARGMSSSIVSSLRSASSGAYSCGRYIGTGLANGMASALGYVRSVATQLATAAEAAIRAKAKIHSPSRVSTKLGGYWGAGWVNGILDKVKDAVKATKQLVNIPDIPAFPDAELAYVGGYGSRRLDDDYDYNPAPYIRVEVPVNLDGKEVAKVATPYIMEEQGRIETRNNRKHGKS